MRIFLFLVGIIFLLMGALAALAILIFPFFHLALKGSEGPLLFVSSICSMAGFLLVALAIEQGRVDREVTKTLAKSSATEEDADSTSTQKYLERLLRIAGVEMVLLALLSAAAILTTKIGWLPDRSTRALWWMFVPCTILGELLIFTTQSTQNRRLRVESEDADD